MNVNTEIEQFEYNTCSKERRYEGQDPLKIVSETFYSKEFVVNDKYKVTAQGENFVLHTREIVEGSLEKGTLTLRKGTILFDADDIDTLDIYKIHRG